MPATDQLEQMLASGQDSALLRFALGNAYLQQAPVIAAEHLRAAVRQNPDYSAAWKLLGKALLAADDPRAAEDAFRTGIAAAARHGDKQAEREMQIFLKRLTGRA